MRSTSFQIQSKEDTEALANFLAPKLNLGDAILLIGDLAAGKTYFVKALAAALGSKDPVTSPTFTIAHFYHLAIGQMLHIDAYRLDTMKEFLDLGLADFYEDCVTVVEWGDKVAAEYPDALRIELTPGEAEESRHVTLSGSDRWSCAIEGAATARGGQ